MIDDRGMYIPNDAEDALIQLLRKEGSLNLAQISKRLSGKKFKDKYSIHRLLRAGYICRVKTNENYSEYDVQPATKETLRMCKLVGEEIQLYERLQEIDAEIIKLIKPVIRKGRNNGKA